MLHLCQNCRISMKVLLINTYSEVLVALCSPGDPN